MKTLLDEMHTLGAASPTSEQFRVNGLIALKTMLQTLPQLWVQGGCTRWHMEASADDENTVKTRIRFFGCRLRVTSDKTHFEQNESAVTLIAAVPSDLDFRCNGPIVEIEGCNPL